MYLSFSIVILHTWLLQCFSEPSQPGMPRNRAAAFAISVSLGRWHQGSPSVGGRLG